MEMEDELVAREAAKNWEEARKAEELARKKLRMAILYLRMKYRMTEISRTTDIKRTTLYYMAGDTDRAA